MASRSEERARRAGVKEGAGRTLAQTSCLVGGLALVAFGILGFFFGGSGFGAGSNVQGQDFIVFEVNGWHNIVHIVTGGFLLLTAPTPKLAVTGLLIFGLLYAGMTVWGFIDGNDVANIVPVNTADNWLHLALAGLALLIAVLSGGLLSSARRT